jgi:hypothetical protein
MGARNRVGLGLSYRSARLHRLAKSIPGIDSWVPYKFKNASTVHAFSVELLYTVAQKKFVIGCEKMCNFFLRAGGWGWGTLRFGARPEIEKTMSLAWH